MSIYSISNYLFKMQRKPWPYVDNENVIFTECVERRICFLRQQNDLTRKDSAQMMNQGSLRFSPKFLFSSLLHVK